MHGTPCFQDAAWRTAVFNAVKDGQDGASGATLYEALANFTGDVDAKKLGITDVHGIDLLRKANTVDVSHNEIKDLSYLGQNTGDLRYKEWFGMTSGNVDDREAGTNVHWNLGGNPFGLLPENFGGYLTIAQAGTTNYSYPDDAGSLYVYSRPDSSTGAVSGTVQVGKTKINKSGVLDNAKLEIVSSLNRAPYTPLNITGWDHDKNDSATFEGLTKSSSMVKLAVGIDEELHYWTDDQYGTVTPGSQSFKYYITDRFQIYDKVTVLDDYNGEVTLTKKEEGTANPLSGAEYELYHQDGTLYDTYTTGANGQIHVSNLALGGYYFKEKKAPAGYVLDQGKIAFELKGPTGVSTVLDGGVQQITPTGSPALTAKSNERFMVGPNDVDPASPDITLAQGSAANIKKVTVDCVIDNNGQAETVHKEFTTAATALKEAQDLINNYKNNNLLRGKTVVRVAHTSGGNAPAVTCEAINKKSPANDIKVTKVWKDNAGWTGTHPDITIRLLQSGKEIDHITLPTGSTEYTFKNLPETDENGTLYVYSVVEDHIISTSGPDSKDGYSTSIHSTNDGFEITNTWSVKDRIKIAGEKKWDDFNDKHEKRPDTVTINLKQNGIQYASAVASEKNGWKFTFNNIPMYPEESDHLYQYTIEEESASNDYKNSGTITVKTDGHGNGETIPVEIINKLNESVNTTAELSGMKVWEDYGDVYKKRPASIEVELLQNDKPTGNIQTVSAGTDGLWKYAFKGLDKYDQNGAEYVYTVRENNVPQRYSVRLRGTDLINTIDPSENEIQLEGKKVWKDYNNAYETRPESVEIELLQNGKAYKTATVSSSDKQPWKYYFQSLPRDDSAGKPYKYRVKETAVPEGYTSTVSDDSSTITNTLDSAKNQIVSVQLQKEWKDKESTQSRPDSINISLLRDGKAYKSMTLRETANWKAAVDKLPKYNNDGVEYSYSVTEEKVKGYKQTNLTWQKGSTENIWTGVFTNTKVESANPSDPGKTPTTPTAPTSPTPEGKVTKTGDTLPEGFGIILALMMISAGTLAFLFMRRNQN